MNLKLLVNTLSKIDTQGYIDKVGWARITTTLSS